MYGLELLSRREGLGLSKPAMAEALNIREQNLDRWEFGKNPPRSWDWIDQALTAMEDYQDELVDQMVAAVLERHSEAEEDIIMSYSTRRSFEGWNPRSREVTWGEEQLRGVPVEIHRAAAAKAARRLRREHKITASIEPVPAPTREEHDEQN
ncbi:hypothetical protein [Micrococcus luteus]|uniref:hypothetical protein n=1 Tax=Micrococcus luteus TaxID=1270 RepID=UPI0023033AAE|nr:hypothetical protein [Micrococcus luteus]